MPNIVWLRARLHLYFFYSVVSIHCLCVLPVPFLKTFTLIPTDHGVDITWDSQNCQCCLLVVLISWYSVLYLCVNVWMPIYLYVCMCLCTSSVFLCVYACTCLHIPSLLLGLGRAPKFAMGAHNNLLCLWSLI